MKFFDNNPVGRIITRVSDDIVNVDDLLPASINRFTKLLAIALGYFIVFIYFLFTFKGTL